MAVWTRKPIPDENANYFFAEWHKGEWFVDLQHGYAPEFEPYKAWWMRSEPISLPEPLSEESYFEYKEGK